MLRSDRAGPSRPTPPGGEARGREHAAHDARRQRARAEAAVAPGHTDEAAEQQVVVGQHELVVRLGRGGGEADASVRAAIEGAAQWSVGGGGSLLM